MDTEYILYIQDHLGSAEFVKALSGQKIRFQYYSSTSHHPHAMLLHRSQMTKRVVSSSFPANQKSLIIFFPSYSSSDLPKTTKYLKTYQKNNIKVVVIIQGSEEFFESLKYSENPENDLKTRENFECLLVDWMMMGIDCILTASFRESAGFIEKIIEILTKNPYRADPSKFRIQGKKLKPNTEVPLKQRNWALQLVNIQGISESKALKIIEKFPTLRSLIEFYQDDSISPKDKEQALTFISDRKEKRISKRVFSVFSSVEGDLAVLSTNYNIPEYYGSYYKDFNATSSLAVTFYWSSCFHISPTLDLWVSNPIDHTIMQVLSSSYKKPKGTLIRIAGSQGSANFRDGDLSTSLLNSPKSLSFYNNKVYVADTNNHCIRVIDLNVKSIKQFSGRCTEPGFKDGPSQYNRLNKPDLVGTANGTLFINDKGNNYVRIVDLDTGYMRTLWGGACRDASQIEGERPEPEYEVGASKFYVDNGSIHVMVCDLTLVKESGKPDEHVFDISQYKQPCAMHVTLCDNRTSPYVIRNYSTLS